MGGKHLGLIQGWDAYNWLTREVGRIIGTVDRYCDVECVLIVLPDIDCAILVVGGLIGCQRLSVDSVLPCEECESESVERKWMATLSPRVYFMI